MAKRIKPGQLARLGATLVEVIEVRGKWATVRAFSKFDNQEPQDRLITDLRVS